MPVISIPLPADILKQPDSEKAVGDFVKTIAYKDEIAGSTFQVISRILREYHFNDGGSPYIDGFEVANKYIPNAQKGRIWFKYRIDYYFGCEDRSAGTTFNEGYNFEIDTKTLLLKIDFPEPIIRDTREEF